MKDKFYSKFKFRDDIIFLHSFKKHNYLKYLLLILVGILQFSTINSTLSAQNLSKTPDKTTFSFFAETGETENSFTIAGRNFPVKIGSIGLKASYQINENFKIYSRAGIGYSPKQSVSAFNFNVSGSVFATSIGAGGSGEYRIRKSDFVIVPFADANLYNYTSDTFRGKKDGNQLKASVIGKSYFIRSGIELRYLTTDGYLFFGTGLNRWNIENRVTIEEDSLSITPRLWADNTDTFFQAGAMFETGSGKAMIGARMSDLTHEINTQLVEFFAQVKVEFD